MSSKLVHAGDASCTLFHAGRSGKLHDCPHDVTDDTRRWHDKTSKLLVVAEASMMHPVDSCSAGKTPVRKANLLKKLCAQRLLDSESAALKACKVTAFGLCWLVLRGCKRRTKLYSAATRRETVLDSSVSLLNSKLARFSSLVDVTYVVVSLRDAPLAWSREPSFR